jgi:hypothetical protein
MPKNHDVMVLAGQSGSKSTFIGGLYQHMYNKDLNVSYTPIEGNVREDFINGLIKPMTSRNVYPDQTEEGYVVEITLDGGGSVIPKTNFKFIDIPGEQIDEVLPKVEADISNGEINESKLEQEFNKVKSNIGGDQQITVDDWVTIFKYYYNQATKVMFLLNLHKVIVEDADLTITTEWLENSANAKVKTCVVPTAVDLINYDSDDTNYGSRLTDLDNRMFDKKLKSHVENEFNLGTAPILTNMIQSVANNKQIDMFSVSVPPAQPADPSNQRLKPDGNGGFETRGFDEVEEWLKD